MIYLKDLYLGSIDAKNELLNDSPQERALFLSTFVTPPNLVIDRFNNKHTYFATGMKGTGKTALLRYIAIKSEEDCGTKSSFLLFKSDIDEEYKKEFVKASRATLSDNNSDEYDSDDFETVWRWFIYRKIVSVAKEKNFNIFEPNAQYEKFSALVQSPTDQGDSSGIAKLIPKMKKGNIEISKSPKLGLDFEWDKNDKAKVYFNELVRKSDNLFIELIHGVDKINIFIDELELSHNSAKQYTRDSRLIRDLIVTIEKLNAISKKRGFGLCLYAAIRSEVQTSVASLGKEINKILADFGTEIIWNRAGTDDVNQPLLYVISERLRGGLLSNRQADIPRNKIWETFFPKSVQALPPQRYILHNTWYRPRDVIRLLKNCQDQYPDEQSFGHHVFDAVKKKYSEASWVEITEELTAKYKPEDIKAIKRLLYGYKQVFSLPDLTTHIHKLRELYPEVNELLDRYKVQNILSDLYRIGVIGNIDDRGKLRFVFRGDDDIMLENRCYIHNALKPHLSITKYE